MNWSRITLILILLSLLAGCGQQDEPALETPTPFSRAVSTAQAPAGEPIAISLANLAANPELFEGSKLLLRGQYQPQPQLICDLEAHPSPATWALIGEGLQANASGHDQQLRELINIGQELAVEGRWLRYSGPVGCGKSASVQEVWYLSSSRIVEPNPLARAAPQDEAVAVVPSEPGDIEQPAAEATEFIVEEVPPQLGGETAVPTATLELSEAVKSPTYVPSPEQTSPPPSPSPVSVTLTPSPTSEGGTPDPGTVTATSTTTGTPGSETATPESVTATPTATATASSAGGVINKGQIDYEDLVIGSLDSGDIHSRLISIDYSSALTITVAPSSSANITITVLDPNGQIIADSHDQSGAGEVETITNLTAAEVGDYEIQIATSPAAAADYALMVLDDVSYNFTFMGFLDPGMQRSNSLTADNDHFWFFNADDGETISLQVTPNGDKDPYVELYGPDGSRIETIDNTGAGETELLDNHSILETGLYSVRVGEFDFSDMSYQIVINKT